MKIQTRYRAYKSASLSTSKAYQQYKTGSATSKFNNQKLKSHYQHSSIDETSIINCMNGNCSYVNSQECECVNRRRLIGSDIQLNSFNHGHIHSGNNNQHQYQYPILLANQKQIARKLINIRQSPRYSPASPISPAPSSSSFINSPSNSSNGPNSEQTQMQSLGNQFSFQNNSLNADLMQQTGENNFGYRLVR